MYIYMQGTVLERKNVALELELGRPTGREFVESGTAIALSVKPTAWHGSKKGKRAIFTDFPISPLANAKVPT
jgi:hypothetical protein